jgi:tight adherence protein B
LPAAGIALGAGVGADPMHVLLRTPLGAACAGGAMTFQMVGLAWTQRLANSIKDAA